MKKYLSAILMCSFILSAAGCSSARELTADEAVTNGAGGTVAEHGEASSGTTGGASSGTTGGTSAGTTVAASTGASVGASAGTPDAASTGTPSEIRADTSPSSIAEPEVPAKGFFDEGEAAEEINAGVPDSALADAEGFGYAKVEGEAVDDAAGWDYAPAAAPTDAAPAVAAPADTAPFDPVPFEPVPDCPDPPCPPYIEVEQPQPYAGLLTGGEWRDNDHWPDWKALYDTHIDWAGYKDYWRIDYDTRVMVKVTADGKPLEGAVVTFERSSSGAVSSAVTDNKGAAYLFYNADKDAPEEVTVSFGGEEKTAAISSAGSAECDLSGVTPRAEKKLDFMIMCDTTGSMSDELSYLKEELLNIISRVREENANIPTRLSVNFYRDEGDEYVIREYEFTEDFDEAANAISQQTANGGGDTPEAVHTALDSAVNGHDWDEDSVKIMFLVLDAPPHGDDAQIVDNVNSLIARAAEKGIRVIPIASSGIDKSTEYLLRTMAFTTGGTYTFLTDDSGVGGGHIEPTVGAYNVEKLNDMMVRIVGGYLK